MSVRRVILLCLMVLFAVTAVAQATGRRQNTTRRQLKAAQTAIAPGDTLRGADAALRFSGFEKVQASTKESLFVTNNSGREISALRITIVYLDARGRELHRRTESIALSLPPGGTRQLQLKSWDSQKVWHYTRTQGRHNSYSTPFDIRLSLEWAIAVPEG